MPDARFSDVIGRFYDAGTGETSWTGALAVLADQFSALYTSVTIGQPDARTGSVHGPTLTNRGSGVSPVPAVALEPNPIMRRLWQEGKGRVSVIGDIGKQLDINESTHFRGFIRDYDLGHSMHVFRSGRNGETLSISVIRSEKRNNFRDKDAFTLRVLEPHLTRAVRIYQMVQAHASEDALFNQLSNAIVFVDETGRILTMNYAAEDLLRAGEHLSITAGDRLIVNEIDDLGRLIAQQRRPGHTVSPISLNSGGRGGLPIMLAPIPIDWRAYAPAAVAMVVIGTSDVLGMALVAHLAQHHGLTPGETRFLNAFLRTGSLSEAAVDLSIQRETARRHIKSIFAKTETHNQAQLMRLILHQPSAFLRNRSS